MKLYKARVVIEVDLECEDGTDPNDAMNEVVCDMSLDLEGADLTSRPEIVNWNCFSPTKEVK